MHHLTDRIAHTTVFVTPVVEHWLEWEIAQWVHHEGSILWPIAPWVNALTTELHWWGIIIHFCVFLILCLSLKNPEIFTKPERKKWMLTSLTAVSLDAWRLDAIHSIHALPLPDIKLWIEHVNGQGKLHRGRDGSVVLIGVFAVRIFVVAAYYLSAIRAKPMNSWPYRAFDCTFYCCVFPFHSRMHAVHASSRLRELYK